MKEEQKINGEISVKDSKFLSWLDNFWYHYKWVTIIVAFFVIVALICIVQACGNKPSDIIVTYAGGQYLSDDNKVSVENVLSASFSEDNEDGKLDFGLSAYNIYTKEQIIALEKETNFDGKKKYSINTAVNTEQMSTFQNQLGTGSGSILLMDKELYEFMFNADGETERLMPLSEVLGETPSGAIDAYAVRLGDTDMYKNNRSIRCLPADTVICLHKKIISQRQSDYDVEIDAFKAFIKVTD